MQVICEVGKAVGSEGLVAGQIVDIKSEGQGETVGLQTLQVGPDPRAHPSYALHNL